MNDPTRWIETARHAAAALVTRSDRTPALGTDNQTATPAKQPWTWNPHDVWLSRIQPPRELAVRISMGDSATRPRLDTAPRN